MRFPVTGWLITHSSKESCQYLVLNTSHRDDLVFVDPQQISNDDVLPLHCAETEADHMVTFTHHAITTSKCWTMYKHASLDSS